MWLFNVILLFAHPHPYENTHTHTNKQTSQHTNTYANGKREKQFIGVWGRESWRCLFFEQIDVVFDSWNLQQKRRQINKHKKTKTKTVSEKAT